MSSQSTTTNSMSTHAAAGKSGLSRVPIGEFTAPSRATPASAAATARSLHRRTPPPLPLALPQSSLAATTSVRAARSRLCRWRDRQRGRSLLRAFPGRWVLGWAWRDGKTRLRLRARPTKLGSGRCGLGLRQPALCVFFSFYFWPPLLSLAFSPRPIVRCTSALRIGRTTSRCASLSLPQRKRVEDVSELGRRQEWSVRGDARVGVALDEARWRPRREPRARAGGPRWGCASGVAA